MEVMDMKKFVVIILLLLLLLLPSTVFAIRPHYVYDRADILTDVEEFQIHSFCEQVDQNTTVEIVVVTLPNLVKYGGDIDQARVTIFNEEALDGVKGIGKTGKDNGVLIVIAVAERKWGIEVGYGLEGNLTDSEAGRIGRNKMVPELKNDNWFVGLMAGVKGVAEEVTSPVGESGTEDALKINIPPEFWWYVIVFLSGVVFIYLGWKVLGFVYDWNEERVIRNDQKKSIKMRLDAHVVDNIKLEEEINRVAKIVQTYPKWAQKEVQELAKSCAKGWIDIHTDLLDAKTYLQKGNLYGAEKYLKSVNETKSALQTILYSMGPVKQDEIKIYEKETPKKLRTLDHRIKDVDKFLQTKKDEGLKVTNQIALLKTIKYDFPQLKDKLYSKTKEPNKKSIYQEILFTLQTVNEMETSINQRLETRDRTNSRINLLPKEITRVEKGIPHAEEVIVKLMGKHPKEIWQPLEFDMANLPARLVIAKRELELAEQFNDMRVQNFDVAEGKITNAEAIVMEAKDKLEHVFEVKEDLHKTKNDIPLRISSAESAVANAKEITSHNDVGREAKQLANEAETKLKSAKSTYDSYTGSEIINWLVLASTLALAIKLSNDAVTGAKNDKDRAITRRRKRREEQERARQRSYARSSSSSGGGYGGGFGGGFSGGGGASGGF
jgi:uncharacterized membrane protein YgcG